ncbi:MAG: response regulator [Candidatus Hydrothermarchaeales archaeon]
MAKIMVVDDEADMRFMVRKILENEGHEVIEAEAGKVALDKLKEVKPDLILLDVMMPGLDGWEVCKQIRENKETENITVTMLTVKSTDEDKVTSFDDGLADWHISKPFKKKRFVKTVKWLLESPLERKSAP